ncbi:hypothetical protein M0C34_13375 [Agarivorans sp. TSD2052]|uniref:hypothetical protein n=1 Tax=Agarivorans sp. TSD2052 TaxID=2937286 RepID=UPI00200C5014|nr:hypothetical protein [Agarivorans sp. TSD2052]UPW17231.1 hypothetical protein M0C34_13375 [Agarivorans sp. TSD2052]
MHNLEEIKQRSASDNELVVCYTDAMALLSIYELSHTKVLGWEGWMKYKNGNIGHSKKYQGTVDLSALPKTSAITLCKSTIMQAFTEWQEKPEASEASLLFCITTNT